ncbi:hypothetical protein AGLY_001656 [Aphis glycines]|uniref:Uncharacterized protein n=1 Tax=Aphis glycines TaxID=307491 RepID=A0A6G0U4T6_APHGL|nr:hypothetical protein AGLY_001656 [Aphis glycines]
MRPYTSCKTMAHNIIYGNMSTHATEYGKITEQIAIETLKEIIKKPITKCGLSFALSTHSVNRLKWLGPKLFRFGMFSTVQTDSDVSKFFGKYGKRTTIRADIDTYEDSQSRDQTESQSSATELGTSVYQKSEADQFFEELEKFIITHEYGDSDTDNNRNTGNHERRTTSSNYVGITDDEFIEMCQDEHRQKSPGFGDFFRINDNHLQSTDRNRRSNILSVDNYNFNDDDVMPETNTRHIAPEEVDDLFTEDSDNDERDGDNNFSTETFATSPMLLCHLDAMELFDSLTTFADTLSSTESNLSSSSANTTTMSKLHTPVCKQTKLVGVHGSNAVAISESIDESTFEDAFMRATSEVATGWPLCDIFVQTGASQKKAYVPGADEGLYHQIRNFSTEQNTICSKEGLVETCVNEGTWDVFGEKSTLRRGDAGSKGHIGRRLLTAQSKNEIDVDGSLPVNIEDLLKYYPICLPDAFINIK